PLTVRTAVMVTTQRPLPLQPPPLHPLKTAPGPALAVRVTIAPPVKSCAQLEPQAIPCGALVTVPLAEPRRVTASANRPGGAVNVAVTVVAVVTVPEPRPALTAETASDGTIVSVSAFEAPPPGGGLRTVTLAVPAAAISLAEIVARSCVRLTNVVGRLAPFHWITEL